MNQSMDKKKIYHIVFKNRLAANADPKTVQSLFMSRFNVPSKACKQIFSGRRIRIKKGISQQTALQFQDTLFQIGMLCDIELDASYVPIEKKDTLVQPQKNIDKSDQSKTTLPDKYHENDYDDDEDDDIEASFDLAEILLQENNDAAETDQSAKTVTEIIKQHDNHIIDIQYLDGRKKYIDTDNRFCIVEQKGSKAFFYFNDFIHGEIVTPDGKTVDTQSMCVDQYLFHKSKRIFRKQIPDQGHIELTDDRYTYHIQQQKRYDLPPKKLLKAERSPFFKHFSKSLICHLILILFIGWFISFDKPEPEQPKRFAKIAGHKIHDLQKIRKNKLKPSAPKKQEIVKLSPKKIIPPAKTVKKVKPVQKTHPKKTVAAVKQNSVKKGARRQKNATTTPTGRGTKRFVAKGSASKSRDTGNGGPVGNVSTPNVQQKGLLGLLKDTGLSLLPNDALAAVTQLDTVDVPGSFVKDTLKISGIKGHLGDAKIQMPGSSGGGLVNTKSESQVLRTGGGDGSGSGQGGRRVGELAKGNIGNHDVKAMIRANFNQSFQHIQGGGISRAAVKKVIDQHIDDITYCYEVALISDPSIVGKAVYEWRILMNGSVGDVHILNASIQNQQILGCIKKSIKTWDFPKPHRSQVLVSYPFVFDIVGF